MTRQMSFWQFYVHKRVATFHFSGRYGNPDKSRDFKNGQGKVMGFFLVAASICFPFILHLLVRFVCLISATTIRIFYPLAIGGELQLQVYLYRLYEEVYSLFPTAACI